MRKILAALLALVMTLTLLPAAWAVDDDEESQSSGNTAQQAATNLPSITVGGSTTSTTVYFATNIDDTNQRLQCSENAVGKTTVAEGSIKAFTYTNGNAGDNYFIAVGGKTADATAPTLVYHVGNDTNFTVNPEVYLNNESDKFIYKLTIPEVGNEPTTVDFVLKSGSDENNDIGSFAVVFKKGQQDGDDHRGNDKTPWVGTAGTTPTNPLSGLKALYDGGFRFPSFENDIHFSFPDTLKAWTDGCGNDWDYRLIVNEGIGEVRILVNNGNRDRWENTVKGNTDTVLADGVYFRYYFGNSDSSKPTAYGYDWYGSYEENNTWTMGDSQLSTEYNHNNGLHLANVNRVSSTSSVLALNSEGEDWIIALAMSDTNGAVSSATYKYAFRLIIEATKSTSFTIESANGTAVAKDRITASGVHTAWKALIPAEGSVFLRPTTVENRWQAATNQYGQIADLTVTAPAGYTLKSWNDTSTGRSGSQFPIPLYRSDYQPIYLTWNASDGSTLTEYVIVECHNKAEWFTHLGNGTSPQQTIFTAAELSELNENGIYVSYDNTIGYFSVSVDATKLKDINLLTTAIRITAPDGAAYFKGYSTGGSENPATHDWQESVNKAMETLNNPEMLTGSVEDFDKAAINLLSLRILELGDLTVYYADSQVYRSGIVQWMDANKNVIGYSYVYGRNSDFSMSLPTAVVKSLSGKQEVDRPTLVSEQEGLRFTCDKNPQVGGSDGRKVFFQFDLFHSDGREVTIYLPYDYFNMTREQGLALERRGLHPTVYHYLDDACTTSETLTGTYTDYGVMFVTNSFSPYVIDCTVNSTEVTTSEDGASGKVTVDATISNIVPDEDTGLVTLVVKPTVEDGTVGKVNATIPSEEISNLKKAEAVKVETDIATLTIDKKALGTMLKNIGETDNLVLSVKKSDESTAGAKFELTAKVGDENVFVNSPGKITVTVDWPTAPGFRQQLVCYCTDGGKYERMSGLGYHGGQFSWDTNHFSTFEIKTETIATSRAYIDLNSGSSATATTTTTTGKASSATTFDAGVGIYAVSAILSVTGMAWVGKKKH